MLSGLSQRLADRATTRRLRHLARTHPLRYLFVELTRRCTLACAYCGSDCVPASPRQELTSAAWVDILRQIAVDFEPENVMLAFTGGEPLLKPGFFDVIEEAGRLGFPFGMVSNGTAITPDVAQRLAGSGIGAISLSLDAPPALNDELRGHGTTAKVERAISHLRDAGFGGRLEALSTITKPVVPYLDALRRHLATLRVGAWRLAPVIPIGRASRRPELLLDATDVRSILEFVRRGRADGWLPRPEFGDECYLGHDFEGTVRPYRFQCRAGITVGGILADGRIGACPELGECFVQGDIRRERFVDVWNERYQIFRDRQWTRRGTCASCEAFAVCQGGSLHLYLSLDGAPLRCLYRMLRDGEEGRTPRFGVAVDTSSDDCRGGRLPPGRAAVAAGEGRT